MRVVDVIAAKRDGKELAEEDIFDIVLNYAKGQISDYQMSAFLMAVYIRGFSFAETSAMTRAMVLSGEVINLSAITGTKVDKHSTGGVGDKTTLVVVPILAACGLKVPKMSGRGLGFTGGTLDKLESIPGFNTGLSAEEIAEQVNHIGAAMAGQTADIVPADKKIYALRDVTGTVESIPLIAASIMSKKIASSSDVILLDVKVGSGAFVRTIDKARELAKTMIAIGKSFDKRVGAVITDMNQPLGQTVGNALEVREAIEALSGALADDPISARFRELCVELSAIMLYIAGQSVSVDEARKRVESVLSSGAALAKFREIVEAQGGDVRVVEDPSLLLHADHVYELRGIKPGFIAEIYCAQVGVAASILGAGRERKEDAIDPAVGIVVKKQLGDRVENGDVIAVLHTNDPNKIPAASAVLLKAYKISDQAKVPPLIYEIIQ